MRIIINYKGKALFYFGYTYAMQHCGARRVLNVYAACMKYYSLYLIDVTDNVHE